MNMEVEWDWIKIDFILRRILKSEGKVMVIEYWNGVRLDWDLNMNKDEY